MQQPLLNIDVRCLNRLDFLRTGAVWFDHLTQSIFYLYQLIFGGKIHEHDIPT